MRVRRISVLIDGGFFYKRIKSWADIDRNDPIRVADAARYLCKRHVQKLIGEVPGQPQSKWLDHVYRLFYYDAHPYDGVPHHPLHNKQIKFGETDEANFRRALFDEIKKKRKFALRLGTVINEGYWTPYNRHMKGLLKIKQHVDYLAEVAEDPTKHDPAKSLAAAAALDSWKQLAPDDIALPLRQKGVDMRIGLDISTMTLKGQVDTIVLVTGDSDFVPAAKMARREGVEFILDPMWQSVNADLNEHVDGITSGFDRPGQGNPAIPPADEAN
jgi:uncharacterized LabA/DUF88 family protein